MSSLRIELPPELVDAITEQVLERIAADAPPAEQSPWLNHTDAAAYMAATPKRLYELVHARAVPVFKDGSRNVYRRDDLDAYLEGRLER
jgi:hypothetical protein